MIDIDKIEQAAEAAAVLDHNECPNWYTAEEVAEDTCPYPKNARFIAACDPQTILKLIAVVRAAKATMTVDQDDTVESLAADLTLYAALEALK